MERDNKNTQAFRKDRNAEEIRKFAHLLRTEEHAEQTIRKYMHELEQYQVFLGERESGKETLLAYRVLLSKTLKPQTVNGKLCAINAYFRLTGRAADCVKLLRVQHSSFVEESKLLHQNDYNRLIAAARESGNERLALLIQTIEETGIRISELSYITLQAVQNKEARIALKGKCRVVILTDKLCQSLRQYADTRHISTGSIFISRTGKPLNRSNIWRDMKKLCEKAQIAPEKVFPHSLRHLFARRFYAANKDLAYLADILGHSSVNTTRIYTAISTEQHRRMLERMQCQNENPAGEY